MLIAVLCWHLYGCEAAWITPTPEVGDGPATVAPAGPGTPWVRPTETPPQPPAQPTPTTFLASLAVGDAPIQSWTNPNDVRDLVFDGEYLWAATSGGVVRWDADMQHYQTFGARDGLASPATLALALDGQRRVWVGYDGLDALSTFDGEGWRTYTRQEAIATFYEDMLAAEHTDLRLWIRSPKSDWLWLPTYDGQVRAYDGQTWRAYGSYEGVRRDTAFVAVSATGRVWAVGDGVSTVLEGYRWWQDHSLFSEIPGASHVTSVAIDADGRLWIAFAGSQEQGGGICSLDTDESRWTGVLHAMTPAIPRQVHDIVIDPAGTVWLAGEEGVSYQRPGEMWRRVDLPGETAQAVLVTPSGRLWLGTTHGIWSVTTDGRDLRGPWLVPTPFTGRQVTRLRVDREGRLFLGTPQGLAYAVPSGPTGLILPHEPRAMAVGAEGELWVATSEGLWTVRGEDAPVQVLEGGVSLVTVDPGGAAWAVTAERQLLRIGPGGPGVILHLDDLTELAATALAVRGDGTIFVGTALGLGIRSPDGAFTIAAVEDGLPDLEIRALAVGPGDELWIATANGLGRLLPEGRWTRFTVASTEGGLRSASVVDLHVDETGTLWLATSAGLSVRTPEAQWSFLDLPGIRAVCPESAEVVWLGGQGGLYRVQREALTVLP